MLGLTGEKNTENNTYVVIFNKGAFVIYEFSLPSDIPLDSTSGDTRSMSSNISVWPLDVLVRYFRDSIVN